MHYNQFTKRYHFEKDLADDISNSIFYFYATLDSHLQQNEWLKDIFTDYFKLSSNVSIIAEKISELDEFGKYSLEETEMSLIKESIKPLGEMLYFLKNGDYEKKIKDLTEQNKVTLMFIYKELSVLLLMFHGSLGIGVNPDKLDEYVIPNTMQEI